jgi:hypothetical protein
MDELKPLSETEKKVLENWHALAAASRAADMPELVAAAEEQIALLEARLTA